MERSSSLMTLSKMSYADTVAGKRQFDERRTLELARDIFWAKGYGATSIQDIANASGVLRGSLYNAYQDKATLFLQVFEDYARDFLAEAARVLADPDVGRAQRAFYDVTNPDMPPGDPGRRSQ